MKIELYDEDGLRPEALKALAKQVSSLRESPVEPWHEAWHKLTPPQLLDLGVVLLCLADAVEAGLTESCTGCVVDETAKAIWCQGSLPVTIVAGETNEADALLDSFHEEPKSRSARSSGRRGPGRVYNSGGEDCA